MDIERARKLLEQVRALLAEEGESQSVAATDWDSLLFSETVQAAPRLSEAIWALKADTHYATDLYQDLFCYLWQQGPLIRRREQMRPSRWANWTVLATLDDEDGVQALRRACRHDAMATAETLVTLSEAIRAWIKRVDPDPKAELAEAAYQLGTALAEADGFEGGFEGTDSPGGGPGGPSVEEAVAGLEAALEAYEAASGTDAPQAGPVDTASLRAGLDRAVADAGARVGELAAARSAYGLDTAGVEHLPLGEQVRLGEKIAGTRLSDFHHLLGRLLGAAAGPDVLRAQTRPKGVRLSADVAELLPVELAAMAVPGLQLDFLTRLADEELLTYARTGPKQRGPLVVLVDESASMNMPGGLDEYGRPVARLVWAKALTLALARQMRAESRPLRIVSFASGNQQQVFADDAESLIDFACHHFNGNTAFEAALRTAAELLVEDEAADLVFITDDDRDAPSKLWQERWRERSARWRTVGISVGVRGGSALHAICDEVIAVQDLLDPATFARAVALI